MADKNEKDDAAEKIAGLTELQNRILALEVELKNAKGRDEDGVRALIKDAIAQEKTALAAELERLTALKTPKAPEPAKESGWFDWLDFEKL